MFSKADTCNLGVAYLRVSSNKVISNRRCCSFHSWKGNTIFGFISCLSQTKREEACPNYLQKVVNEVKNILKLLNSTLLQRNNKWYEQIKIF